MSEATIPRFNRIYELPVFCANATTQAPSPCVATRVPPSWTTSTTFCSSGARYLAYATQALWMALASNVNVSIEIDLLLRHVNVTSRCTPVCKLSGTTRYVLPATSVLSTDTTGLWRIRATAVADAAPGEN
eukprot:CAMPEP_0204021726 /NCGR_PEP_ID=MMETSP0360-20130528/30282_1 /ASSEMBLY_ACC=CAM_ASM_000342 /TAXON_ID=268821 /ORGANISM="Scrippsiella Hangoei, Strain SHTV-5" /LENGTH=130 /DNA_ID=CAMNT_0050965139 /DNA_START=200 /DNA_END=592 /DNA_ORIENTATION=-